MKKIAKTAANLSVWRLAWRFLSASPLSLTLNLCAMVLALAAMCFVMVAGRQVQGAFERDWAGIDLVVGAKGSPLQLILAGVLHIDVPPGNVPLAQVEALAKNKAVAELIPISLGDSFRGHRIVGTTPAYAQHYQMQLAQGRAFGTEMEATLGFEVAARQGLQLGSRFVGTHGLQGGGEEHGGAASTFTVVGIYKPCRCVLDRLILTPTESVWRVHEKATALTESDEDTKKALAAEREITLALIRYSSPLAAVSFPRFVNASTPMQAAAPALEVTRLYALLGAGTAVLRGFALALLAVAALGLWVAMWSAVRERRGDLATLRLLGASAARVGAVVLAQALLLAALALPMAWLLGHGMVQLAAWALAGEQVAIGAWDVALGELWLLAFALSFALAAAAAPAWAAYRTDVGAALAER